MALDETLFRHSQEKEIAILRFYCWDAAAVTFGYSEPYPETAGPGAVRRFTGGGQVEHGDDLTFLLTLPSDSAIAALSASARYEWIHGAIRKSLAEFDFLLMAEEDRGLTQSGPCFQTPVPFDLLSPRTGRKIVGGAQRRSRGAVIHQGSLRLPNSLRENHEEWTSSLTGELALETLPFPPASTELVFERAERLVRERYQTDSWNHRR